MIIVIIDNLGIYQPVYEHDQESFIKVDNDIRDRDIWLRSIKYICTKEQGCEDDYDTKETYRVYFQVNTGRGGGKQFIEDWTLVLQITIDTYYKTDEEIAKEILAGLRNNYHLIDEDEIYGAFLYRRFYMPTDITI